LRIAQVAPPFETVPPTKYGGTEFVVATLTEELVRRGHDVTLFAAADSRTSARLVPVIDQALWHHPASYRDFLPFWNITLGKLASRLAEFDVVHSHIDHLGFPLSRVAPCPFVTTLHGRLDLPELGPLYAEFPDTPVVSISNAQRGPIGAANWVDTVYHGVPLADHIFNPQRGDYLAFLGRISPEKGLDSAIRVARRAGLPLKIAARMPLPFQGDANARADWEYYETQIAPSLQDPGVEFIGEVGGREKNDFLRNAAALLFPIRWPEPFGLVMIEALACGTPVLALRHGSVPEVVEQGVTGFICDNEDELTTATRLLDEIDRARCRLAAERRFSAPTMANAYERVYQQLVEQYEGALAGPWASAGLDGQLTRVSAIP
jgi:glycosyltransferase involved in cell wall biosynthesis